ncbi:MAG: sigma-70 family RNA polymerase sigma factor [Patescibacteria group bacterium]
MGSVFSGKNKFDRLARAMQRGEEAAADALYRELFGKVYGFCMSRVRERHISEDLAQEIFLKLVNRIETFDAKKGGFLVWFWQLARNTLIDHYRREKQVVFSDIADEGGGEERIAALAAVQGPEEYVARVMERERVHAFVRTLSDDDQELFQLRYIADLPYGEIAAIMGKPHGALRVAVSRLKKKIKLHLTP